MAAKQSGAARFVKKNDRPKVLRALIDAIVTRTVGTASLENDPIQAFKRDAEYSDGEAVL